MIISISARKNPRLNLKLSVNDAIRKHYELSNTLRSANVKNSFVSFTSIEKLGINPSSRYKTPLGIYSYPSEYIIRTVDDSAMRTLPFAGDAPFANIFSVKGRILNLNTIKQSSFTALVKKIKEVIGPQFSEKVDRFVLESEKNAKFRSVGGRFWYVTMKVAELIVSQSIWPTKKQAIAWNLLFTRIGINGCVDASGEGIIHTAEETQAVFFNTQSIVKYVRVHNKYSKEAIQDRIERGKNIRDQKYRLSLMTPAERLDKLNKNGMHIQYVKNPTEEMKLTAVKNAGLAIKHIKNPSEELMLLAIERSGGVMLKYIKNPTKKVQYVAVKRSPHSIQYIDKPSKEIQILAVSADPTTVEYIENPSQEVLLAAFDSGGSFVIQDIENPSEEVQLAAVKDDPTLIKYIKNPTKKVQLAVDIQNED